VFSAAAAARSDWARFASPTRVPCETIDFAGKPRVAIFEPWLDERCAEIAISWCPALIRRTREEQLTVHPIKSRKEVRLLASNGWVEGPLEAETKANPVVMWCKLIVLNTNIQLTDERQTPR
jgi:hypothetical protein